MTNGRIPRITRCKLCRYYMPARWGMMCALHHHVATDRDGCTWGAEDPEDAEGGEEDVSNGTYGTKS